MDDDTQTPTTPVTTDATPAPSASTKPVAAATPAPTEPSTPSAGADSQPEADDKLEKYAASQGLELDSPSAIKAAKLAMKNQSEATKRSLKASELEKAASVISDDDATTTATATGKDPELMKRLQRVEIKESVREFWGTPLGNGDLPDKSFEPAMVEVLGKKPYLAGDIESLYATAVMKAGGLAAVKSQGKREALETLAQNQQAAVPTGSSTTRATPKQKDFKDLSIAEMEKKLGFVKR